MEVKQSRELEADARWQRAQREWGGLGYHAKVYYLEAHLLDGARKGARLLTRSEAHFMAVQQVDEENAQLLLIERKPNESRIT